MKSIDFGQKRKNKFKKNCLILLVVVATIIFFSFIFQKSLAYTRATISFSAAGDQGLSILDLRNPYALYVKSNPNWLRYNELENDSLYSYILNQRANLTSRPDNLDVAIAAVKRIGEPRFEQATLPQKIAFMDTAKKFLSSSCPRDAGACGDLALLELLDPRFSDLIVAISIAKKGSGRDPHATRIFQKLNSGRGVYLLRAIDFLDPITFFILKKSIVWTDSAKEKADELRNIRLR